MLNYAKGRNLWFHESTPQAVRDVLETAYAEKHRIRVWVGDVTTGRAWAEEHDVIGRLGRSTGQIKVPLLMQAGESYGSALLDHCIVRIDVVARRTLRQGESRADGSTARSVEQGRTLYQHPSFHVGDWAVAPSDMKGYTEVAMHDGTVQARFKKQGAAARYVGFMQGNCYRM